MAQSHVALVTIDSITRRISVTTRQKQIIEYLLARNSWAKSSEIQGSLGLNYNYIRGCIRSLVARCNQEESVLFAQKLQKNILLIRTCFSKQQIVWVN